MNRRQFLALTAATPLLPLIARSEVEREPDVVIVGAGAAGIAAAHILREAGVSFTLLEAGRKAGGRVQTDTRTFGVPFDLGAHWVQVPETRPQRNPYYTLGRDSDYRFYRAEDNYRIFTPDEVATDREVSALWSAYDDVRSAIGRAGNRNRDVSAASVAPDNGPWHNTARFIIGPWSMAKDLERFSCVDWWSGESQNDWFCAAGYGTLVADHLGDLPVMLETRVSRIRWGSSGVTVETSKGSIRTRAVIVTASTGVLAAEGITFDPALSAEKQEAFQQISMGDYNHIALKFREDIFDMGENGYVVHQVDDSREAIGTMTNSSGTGLAYCDVGGSFARDLEEAGENAAIDFALERLRAMIGRDVDRYFEKGVATGWSADPHFRGAYASAEPGAFSLRQTLRAPVGDRVFFAGEACHESLWATVTGADNSGRDVARAVVRELS